MEGVGCILVPNCELLIQINLAKSNKSEFVCDASTCIALLDHKENHRCHFFVGKRWISFSGTLPSSWSGDARSQGKNVVVIRVSKRWVSVEGINPNDLVSPVLCQEVNWGENHRLCACVQKVSVQKVSVNGRHADLILIWHRRCHAAKIWSIQPATERFCQKERFYQMETSSRNATLCQT